MKIPKLSTPEDLREFDHLMIVGWRDDQMIITTSCKDKGRMIDVLEYILEECYEWEIRESKYH